MYVFMSMQMHTKLVKQQWGGKILSLYHKVAFFMYERAVFGEYGRAMGITFLGKSEHMRYINFGKFGTLKKQKRFSKIFKRVFHLSKEKEKWLFVGVASYPKLLRTAFLSACQPAAGASRFWWAGEVLLQKCNGQLSMQLCLQYVV